MALRNRDAKTEEEGRSDDPEVVHDYPGTGVTDVMERLRRSS